jgi:choline transport protein
MSEEVRDAASSIPKTMIAVYLINFALIFSATLTVCYHTPNLQVALNDSTTYPAIYVMRQSMSTNWITVLLTIICFLNVASNIVYLAAVTRDLFAFARDKGLPFSKWLSTVHPRRHIPVNACQFSCVVAVLLSLIYIGSPVAFYAITSLLTVSLLQCYCLSIGCVLYRRIKHPETRPAAKFSLGKWGIPINATAVAYSLWAFFWSFWPQYSLAGLKTTDALSDFNWASVILVMALIVAMIYFAFRAKDRYAGPVTEVEERKDNFKRPQDVQ